jgi:hypothetical protein
VANFIPNYAEKVTPQIVTRSRALAAARNLAIMDKNAKFIGEELKTQMFGEAVTVHDVRIDIPNDCYHIHFTNPYKGTLMQDTIAMREIVNPRPEIRAKLEAFEQSLEDEELEAGDDE